MKKSKLIFDSLQTRDRRGQLKNGNPPGDPQVAPRCGAKTRRGNGCQAPAMPNLDVGCTGAQAPARERQKGWSGAARRS